MGGPEDNLGNYAISIGSRVRVIMKHAANWNFIEHMRTLKLKGFDDVAAVIDLTKLHARIQFDDGQTWFAQIEHIETVG